MAVSNRSGCSPFLVGPYSGIILIGYDDDSATEDADHEEVDEATDPWDTSQLLHTTQQFVDSSALVQLFEVKCVSHPVCAAEDHRL